MPTGGNKKKELYEMMPEGTFASYEEFDAYVKDEGTLKEVYGFVPEGYFKDDAEYLGYFGETVKKKEPSGHPSATGTPTTSPLPLKSLSPAEKKRRLQEAAQGLGFKQPTTEVDIEVAQKREELAPKPIEPPQPPDLTVPSDIPQPELRPEEMYQEAPEPMLSEEMDELTNTLKKATLETQLGTVDIPSVLEQNKDKNFVKRILNPEQYASIPEPDGQRATHKMAWAEVNGKYIVYPTVIQDKKTGEIRELEEDEAVEYALENKEYIEFSDKRQADYFSQQYKTVWGEQPPIEKPPKFKPNPDGTQRISDEYYGATRKDGKLVFDTTEKTPATHYERLAAQGFYYNPQNKKTGEFTSLFDGNPDMLFQKYEPQIVDYLRNLEETDPDTFKGLRSKIENNNLTQQDQFNIISEIEGKKAVTLNRDIQIAMERIKTMSAEQEPLMLGEDVLQEGQELPPEAQELADYVNEKIPQLEEVEIQLQTLYQNYPEEVERQWTQKVLEDRWEKSSGLDAVNVGFDIAARKTVGIIPNFMNSTGQFLYRSVGANSTADGWNNFWEQAVPITPSTPIVTTNPETGETEIDWANAMTEVGPQLMQMYLVFGKAAGLMQTGAQSMVAGEISKNTGLFMSGYFASYKDLYDQAKAANLSNEDAHSYASLVAMGVAATELIMPDRNFFKQGAEEALQLTIREAAKGTKGKALAGAIGTFFQNTFKEEVEEFTSDLVTNASAVVADGVVDGANFDAELFDKEGILTTAIVTGLTAGLAGSGKLVGDLKQRNRDLYILSQNYENFQTQLQTLVQTEQVTPENAERLVKEVDALRVAETKVPPTMPVEQKATVVPLVAEKEQLVEEKKELDPVFHAPIDQRIEEIDNEILTETKQKTDDKKDKTGVSGKVREGKEPVQAKPVETPSGEKTETGRVLQKQEEVVAETKLKPIRQLGTGADVWFEEEKYRVNDSKKGVLLNIQQVGDEVPVANIVFETPDEAVAVAKELQSKYPNGIPKNVKVEQYVEQIRKQLKEQPKAKPVKEEVVAQSAIEQDAIKALELGQRVFAVSEQDGNLVEAKTPEQIKKLLEAYPDIEILNNEDVPEDAEIVQISTKPVQKELTPEQNKQNTLVAEIKGYNELTPAKRRTKDGTQKAIRIGQLAQDLGFDLQTDKNSGRFRATNKAGKKVISVSVKEEVAEPREEDITFTKQQIDEGAFNWSGQAYDPKIDLGLPWADIKKGIADIQKGIMSVPAKRVANAMRKVQEDGGYTVKANVAGERMDVFIPLGESLYEDLSREQEEEYAQMYDAWFDSLSPEQKEAEVYFTEYGEDTETEPDQIAEGEALEADTEGSPTKTGTEQKVTPEQEAKAKEYGYANPFQAVSSVNKFTGKDYTIAEFDTIPDSEFKEASEQSETVKKNKATEAKLADIQSRRQSIKERLAEKIKDSRGKLSSGIDPSILKDLIELGSTYIEEGIVKAKDFIVRMRADMKELGIDDSQITDEDIAEQIFKPVKPKPPKVKVRESGRSRTVRKGRYKAAPDALIERVKKEKITYEVYGGKKALKDAEKFFAEYGGITEDNYLEIAADLTRLLKENALENLWAALAGNILSAKGMEIASDLYEQGNEDAAQKMTDRAMDVFNTVSDMQTKAGQINGVTGLLYYLTPEQQMLFYTRTIQRGIQKSNVVRKRTARAKEDADIIEKAVKISQEKAAKKVSDAIKQGGLAAEVKTKAKGKNPRAYKPDLTKANKLISEGFALLKKARGNMTSGGLSPELIEGVSKIVEGYIIKGTTNLKYLYNKIRNNVIDNAEVDLTREDFDAILKEYGLEDKRKEVERQKIAGDEFLKSKVREQIKAQDILAELTYEYYSGQTGKIDDIVSAMQEELGLTFDEAQSIKNRVDTVFKSTIEEENRKLIRQRFRGKRGANEKKSNDAAKNIAEAVLAGALDNDFIVSQLQEAYGIPTLTPADINKLKTLSEKLFRASLFKDEISKEIATFITDKIPTSSFSTMQGLWYASILSGPGTQVANIVGNLFVLAPEIGAQKLASLYDGEFRGGNIVFPNKQSAKRFTKATIRATDMFFEIIKNGATYNKYTEENLTKFKGEFSVENIDKLSFGNNFITKAVAGATQKVYTPVKYMVRALEAGDQGFGSYAFDSEAALSLRKHYYKEGLRGKELQQKLIEDLFGTEEMLAEAKDESIKELVDLGLDASDMLKVKKGMVSYIRRQLNDEVVAEANKFATRVTYKGNPPGIFGVVAAGIKAIHNVAGLGPIARFIIPFVNVPLNIGSVFADWIPGYGLARAYGLSPSGMMDKINPDLLKSLGTRSAKANTAQELRAAYARLTISTALLTAIAILSQVTYTDDDGEEKPLFRISGSREYLDYSERGDAAQVFPEYSISFMGSKPISYKLLPISPGMLVIGEIQDRKLVAPKKEVQRDLDDMAALGLLTMGRFFVEATPLSGLKDLMDGAAYASQEGNEADKFYESFNKSVRKFTVSIAMPNLYKQTLKVFDPTAYSPTDAKEALLKEFGIAFLDEDAGYYFDGFGRAYKNYPAEKYFPLQHWLGQKGEDEVDKVMIEKGVYVSDYVPPKKTVGFTIDYKKRTASFQSPGEFKKKHEKKLDKLGLTHASEQTLREAEDILESTLRTEFITQKEWQTMSVEIGKEAYKVIQANLDKIREMEPKEAEEYVKKVFKREYYNYTREHFSKRNK